MLERVLDKGIVIAGDIKIELLEIELLTIKLRLLIASADKAKEMGIDWWETDSFVSSRGRNGQRELEERVRALEGELGVGNGEGSRAPTRARRSTLSETGVYVYGVAPGDAAGARRRRGRRSVDYPVELVRDGGLAAIASRVDLADFGEEALAERARELDWVAPRALAHEEVLEQALAAAAPLLPFRFGTIYLRHGPGDGAAPGARHASSPTRSSACATGSSSACAARSTAPRRGRRARARDPELAAARRRDRGRLLGRRVHAPASSSSAWSRRRRPRRRRARGATCTSASPRSPRTRAATRRATATTVSSPILNGAYLVERGSRDAFEAEVERLASRARRRRARARADRAVAAVQLRPEGPAS